MKADLFDEQWVLGDPLHGFEKEGGECVSLYGRVFLTSSHQLPPRSPTPTPVSLNGTTLNHSHIQLVNCATLYYQPFFPS